MTEAGLMDHLAMLRSSIGSESSGVQDQPHRIGIPPRYRDPLADQDQWPNVLDLPGSALMDRSEAAQVTLLADTHIPAAHLIVLVIKSDDLTPLRPSSLREISPVLAAWPLDEDRYRFVFTHTVSNLMGQGDGGRDFLSSASALRSEMAQQVSSALRRQVPPDLLFPVEYGDSWSRLKSDRPDVYGAAAEAVGSLMADLHRTLTSVEREDGIFLAALRAPRILERAVQGDIDAAKGDVEKTRTHLRRWTSERDKHTALTQRLQACVAEVRRRLMHLDDAGLTEVRFEFDFTKFDQGAALAKQRWVHQWADRFRYLDELGATTSFGKLRSSAERYADSDLKADVYAVLELCVRCRKPCDKKFLGVKYADKWCSSEHCLGTHPSRLEKASVKVSSLLSEKAAELVEAERNRVRADLRSTVSKLADAEAVRDVATRKAAETDLRLARAEETLERVTSSGDRQRQVASNIERRLRDSWDRQSEGFRHQLACAETRAKRIKLTLGLLAIHQTRDLVLGPTGKWNT